MAPTLDSALDSAFDQAFNREVRASSLYVAYSGGLDSQVLLALSAQYTKRTKLRLNALHVNHGLSPHADDWQAFCEDNCQQLAVPLTVKRLDLNTNQVDLEQTARRARYDWFAQFMSAGAVLLTAHHLDDQAETLLLRLLRGSGNRGLSSIPPSRTLGKGTLVRPLLENSKRDLQQYAEMHGLNWVEDESNKNLAFDRNYIRHQVMPVLSQRWPKGAQQFARSSRHCRDDQQIIDEVSQQDANSLRLKGALSVLDIMSPLCLQRFNVLSRARRRNVLQFILRPYLEYPVSQSRMQEWLFQIEHAKATHNAKLSLNDISINIYNKKIYFLRNMSAIRNKSIRWDIDKPCALDSINSVLAISVSNESTHNNAEMVENKSITLQPGDYLTVRWRQGGERVCKLGETFTRALKKELQAARIEPWLREVLPLVCFRDQIVWSGALGHFSPRLFNSDGQVLNIGMRKNNHKSK